MRKLALKRSLNYVRVTNPSTAILGMSHVRMHVIRENNRDGRYTSAWISNQTNYD
jgi:hypothetical protein